MFGNIFAWRLTSICIYIFSNLCADRPIGSLRLQSSSTNVWFALMPTLILFVKRQTKDRFSSEVLVLKAFYASVMESAVTFAAICWFGDLSVKNEHLLVTGVYLNVLCHFKYQSSGHPTGLPAASTQWVHPSGWRWHKQIFEVFLTVICYQLWMWQGVCWFWWSNGVLSCTDFCLDWLLYSSCIYCVNNSVQVSV